MLEAPPKEPTESKLVYIDFANKNDSVLFCNYVLSATRLKNVHTKLESFLSEEFTRNADKSP